MDDVQRNAKGSDRGNAEIGSEPKWRRLRGSKKAGEGMRANRKKMVFRKDFATSRAREKGGGIQLEARSSRRGGKIVDRRGHYWGEVEGQASARKAWEKRGYLEMSVGEGSRNVEMRKKKKHHASENHPQDGRKKGCYDPANSRTKKKKTRVRQQGKVTWGGGGGGRAYGSGDSRPKDGIQR